MNTNDFEMKLNEIKMQNKELDSLEKFLEVNKTYINASLEELIDNIPENCRDMILKRTFEANEDMKEEMKKFPLFEYLVDKKRDYRSVTYLMYYIITTQIWEKAIAKMLENLGCRVQKTGSDFDPDFSKATNEPDFTVTYMRNGKEVKTKIEIQRANYMLQGKSLECKYSKIDKNILNYIVEPNGNIKFLMTYVGRNAWWNADEYADYGLEYHVSLPVCYKKGYFLRKIKQDSFVNYRDLLELKDFQEVLNKVIK